jgi:hypothetical protein
LRKSPAKKTAVIFAATILTFFLLSGASACGGGDTDQKTRLPVDGIFTAGETFEYNGFDVTVAGVEIDTLATMTVAADGQRVLKINVDYPEDKSLSSNEASLTDIYGQSCQKYLGDGLDYLAPAYRPDIAYVRFVAASSEHEFIFTLSGTESDVRVYLVIAEV